MTEQVDLSRNRELAMRARLTITDPRAQRLVASWLLRDEANQHAIDRNRRIVETCARISHTHTDIVGDWNALAHCLALSLFNEDKQWLMQQTYMFDTSKWNSTERVFQDVFGDAHVGNEFVEHFDIYGDAMTVTRSIV